MLKHVNVVFMILACIVIVASCAGGPLLMDQIFQAELLVENRDTEDNYKVIVNKVNEDIMARVEGEAIPTALYKNGYLQLEENCVNVPRDIAPMLPIAQPSGSPSLEHFWTKLLLWNETIPHGTIGFDIGVNTCKDKKRYILEYESEHFVLCVDNSYQEDTSILASTSSIISQNLYITIKYSKGRIDRNLIKITQNLDKKCQFSNINMVSNGSPLLQNDIKHSMKKLWFNNPTTCHLSHISDPTTCSQVLSADSEPEKKVCIFLHGSGESAVSKPVFEHKGYWGNVHKYTPQCKERIFIKEDTLHRGWNNEELQKSFCKVALYGQHENDTVIRNKIIFAHSMGNLILAGAIMNHVCEMDSSTSWYAIQAPMKGSKAALTLRDICSIKESMRSKAYNLIASKGGYCVNDTIVAVYETLAPSFKGIDQVYEIMKKRVKGALCGNSPTGLWSVYSIALEALSMVVDYKETNDGMVPASSCLFEDSKYATDDYQSQFYNARVNHSDGPCKNGDGVYSSARKPCSWFMWKM